MKHQTAEPPATIPPSPLESSPDQAGEWSIDAQMAERAEPYRCEPCAGTGRQNRRQCPSCEGTGRRAS